MPLNDQLRAHYEAVLEDLKAECQQVRQNLASLQAHMKELNGNISSLQKRINPDSPRTLAPTRPPNLKYVNISVRWAILDLLSDSGAMNTSEIAEALTAFGVQTKAANFANNVSAVLSTTMKEKHSEVEQLPDGKWQLTETGKSAGEYIRSSPKFRRAAGLY